MCNDFDELANDKKDIQMYEDLKPDTVVKRLKMAHSFNTKHFGNRDPSLEETLHFLKLDAPHYRKGSWVNIRGALATYWWSIGNTSGAQVISQTKNPDAHVKKSKMDRCKNVTHEEFEAMLQTTYRLRNWTASSVLFIARYFGCRPSEMNSIQQVDDQKFLIIGSKKREDRGIDRIIYIDDPEIAKSMSVAIEAVRDVPTRNLQLAIEYVAEKTFPRRKIRPTIYSFRHSLGGTLKAAGINRSFVAYLMGHQSTASVDVYGDRRSGKNNSLFILPGVEVEEILSLVREKHDIPYSYKNKRAASSIVSMVR